jgi:hypothetical protein
MIHPDYVTRRFKEAIAEAGLPPVRLHDLRHPRPRRRRRHQDRPGNAAALDHRPDRGYYTSVLPQVARDAAEAAAVLVPRRR